MWSSFAHIADYCILLVRTDPQAPKHKGITYLLVDMHSPGVDVRPLRQITGDPEFNEIFFNDVKVPEGERARRDQRGLEDCDDHVAARAGDVGLRADGRLEVQLRKLIELAKEDKTNGHFAADDPFIRDRIARQWVELQALRFTNYRALTTSMKTGIPGPEGSVAKLHWSETNQRLTKLAIEILGPDAQLDGEDGVLERVLAVPATTQPRQHDRGGNLRGAAQHHRRARARPTKESLDGLSHSLKNS